MSGTNELSIAKEIGSLVEKANHAAHNLRVISDRLDDIQRMQNQSLEVAREALHQSGENAAAIERMEPHIESFKALRNKGIGAIAVVGIIASGLGALIHAKWKTLFG